MGRISRNKINKETYLNYTVDQMGLTNIYRTFGPTAVDDTFFSDPSPYNQRKWYQDLEVLSALHVHCEVITTIKLSNNYHPIYLSITSYN